MSQSPKKAVLEQSNPPACAVGITDLANEYAKSADGPKAVAKSVASHPSSTVKRTKRLTIDSYFSPKSVKRSKQSADLENSQKKGNVARDEDVQVVQQRMDGGSDVVGSKSSSKSAEEQVIEGAVQSNSDSNQKSDVGDKSITPVPISWELDRQSASKSPPTVTDQANNRQSTPKAEEDGGITPISSAKKRHRLSSAEKKHREEEKVRLIIAV